MRKTNSPIDTISIKSRPLKRGNHVLDDYELAKASIKAIDDYTKRYGIPPKIQPKFIDWLKEGVEFVEKKQGSFTEFKEKHIYKEYGDLYQQIIENTNKQNAVLEKKGEFNAKVMSKTEGRSK